MNASYAWNLWQSRCGATDVVDVTAELAAPPNKEHSPEVQQEAEIRTLLTEHGTPKFHALIRSAKIKRPLI